MRGSKLVGRLAQACQRLRTIKTTTPDNVASGSALDRVASVSVPACPAVSTAATDATLARRLSNAAAGSSSSWQQLVRDGVPVNPCRSPHHPAAVEGVAPVEGEELCVQEAYHPESQCFGCGPAAPDGLHLQSFRMPGGGLGRLGASLRFPAKYAAFPGIINGGVVATAMDCHGNWAAAIALMDKGCLPRPPLTLTASMEVKYHEPTPPDTDLLLRSRVLAIRDTPGIGGQLRTAVEVELELLALPQMEQAVPMPTASPAAAAAAEAAAAAPGEGGGGGGGGAASASAAAARLLYGERLLASGRGVFKRAGALRSM